jgi:hypothetical protein
MSEIAKLYENAGVLKECLSPCYINKTWRKTHDCPNCDNRKNYPPFTAEKQIELIKWLSEHYLLEIRRIKDTHEYYIGFNGYKKRVWNATINFENTLAKLINNFWQELTEEEKQQVKGILSNEK